jgi:YidC/Oxa1 family membrane protein insertase
MINLRLVLWVSAVVLIWICIQTWQLENTPRSVPAVAPPPAATTDQPASALPAIPDQPAARGASADLPAVGAATPTAAVREPIRVSTDVLQVEIDPIGGDLSRVVLPGYPVHKEQPDVPVELLSPAADNLFLFHTGLRAADGEAEANHLTPMTAKQTSFALAEGADELLVTLSWEAAGRVAVDKTYRFRRGRYDIGLEYRVRNLGGTPYSAANYLQIQRLHRPP